MTHTAYLLTATTSESGLAGDFDLDGDVDGADFLQWQRTDGTPGGLDDWLQGYNAGAPAVGSAAVPEPSTIALLTLFAAASIAAPRKKTA